MQYKDLNHALNLFRGQIIEGLPYAINQCPKFTSTESLFNWLKIRTKYKHDPNNIELFQTLPTLLDKNFHNITGAGDCDCFTIAVLTLLIANGFYNCGIVLVGRNKFNPVHIYAYVIDENNNTKFLDLTNNIYNYERIYPYKQKIKLNLTTKEKKIMQLQLAEQTTPYIGYIWMPSQNVQIREDALDNLSGSEFQDVLLNEGLTLDEICELSGARAERRKAKNTDKHLKRESKTAIKNAKAEKKIKNADAKLNKSSREKKSAKEIFNDVIDSSKQAVDVYKNIKGEPDQENNNVEKKQINKDETTTDTINLFGKDIPKKTVYIGGSILILTGLAIAYKMKNKTSRLKA